MITTAILIMLVVGIHIGLTIALGRFLDLLNRDDPSTFAEVATPKMVHLGPSRFYFLGNEKFLLLHIIPKSYELWTLSIESRRFANRFRIATIAGTFSQLGIVLYILVN